MKILASAFAIGMAFCLSLPSTGFGDVVADSIADWSTSGTQGENGWTYGFYDATADADGVYDPGDFQEFAGPTWIWTGSQWDENNADGDNVPWTEIAQETGHPNGDNNGDVHDAVRRWQADVSGPATIEYSIAKSNANCGNGTTAFLYHNGDLLDSQTVAFDDATGVTATATANISAGDVIDLALSPLGTDATLNDGCDGSSFSMTVDVVPEPSSSLLFGLGLIGLLRGLRRRT